MAKHPNILFLMTDQQRSDTIGALGNPIIQTPALDRIVRDGTSFTSAYCPSPVCVASRCSFLLGQWAHRTGSTSNAGMPQDRVSVMELLNEAGYQTHGIGKMHFTPQGRKMWGFETRDFPKRVPVLTISRRFLPKTGTIMSSHHTASGANTTISHNRRNFRNVCTIRSG